jgi:hypothetical protein
MHEMLIGHDQEGGIIPGRGEFFSAGQAVFPPAPLAAQTKGFHPIPYLRKIGGLHWAGTAGCLARQRLVLKGADELPMRHLLPRLIPWDILSVQPLHGPQA